MRQVVFCFDVVSPLAWLAFEALPDALVGFSHWVDYQPILRERLCANASPQMFSDEVARARLVAEARAIGFAPPERPFNQHPLLQRAIACAPPGATPGRYLVERLLRHVWQGDGTDPSTPERLAQLDAALVARRDVGCVEVRDELARASDAAAARGIVEVPGFHVPSLQLRLVGPDALAQLRDALSAARG